MDPLVKDHKDKIDQHREDCKLVSNLIPGPVQMFDKQNILSLTKLR